MGGKNTPDSNINGIQVQSEAIIAPNETHETIAGETKTGLAKLVTSCALCALLSAACPDNARAEGEFNVLMNDPKIVSFLKKQDSGLTTKEKILTYMQNRDISGLMENPIAVNYLAKKGLTTKEQIVAYIIVLERLSYVSGYNDVIINLKNLRDAERSAEIGKKLDDTRDDLLNAVADD